MFPDFDGWKQLVNKLLADTYGISLDDCDAGAEKAHADKESPQDYVNRIGEKYGLTRHDQL